MKEGQKIKPEGDFPGKLAQPARRALTAAGIRNLVQLTGFQEGEIRRLHGIGQQALSQLTQAMAERGIAFAPDHKEKIS